MYPAAPITLAIIHGSPLLRLALRTAVEQMGIARIVLELAQPARLAAAWPKSGVQVVLLGLDNAVQLTLETARWLRKQEACSGVIVLGDITAVVAPRFVDEEVSALLKERTLELPELEKAIQVVAHGGIYGNSWMMAQVRGRGRNRQAAQEERRAAAMLTATELKVLVVLCHALQPDVRQAANKLGMAYGTVRNHRNNIYKKLEVHSRTQLLLRAQQLGLV